MSTEETAESGLNYEETELKLGPPGAKRGFSQTVHQVASPEVIVPRRVTSGTRSPDSNESVTGGGSGKPPAAKVQAVGWPPVRSFRRNALQKSCSYVKVAVDGAAYLRKVDLDAYSDYEQLLTAIGAMFSCFTSKKYGKERRLVDPSSGVEYVPTYEDKDGDLMLVGDDPWKLFVSSCKRIRLVKSTEAST
ncbi:Auxin-responsive protein [Rhynchospora pubera]|uniref:Auxin-responsive protein n=1 Tax=Rhynchospora pubera TaxID=906938 RepID=A0AAV8EJM3_9POAL|nr:Auxin-responsive protein [Rhynchospora pubera]